MKKSTTVLPNLNKESTKLRDDLGQLQNCNNLQLPQESPPSQKLVFFDLDHTLINGNVSFLFGKYLYRNKKISLDIVIANLFAYALHKGGFLSMEGLHQAVFNRLFIGKKSSDFVKAARNFLQKEINIYLNPTLFTTLQKYQREGHKTVLLSSSPSFIIEILSEILKIDYFGGTHYLVDKRGCFAHISHMMDGRAKADFVRRLCLKIGVAPAETIAFSDSILDLPFMEAAGTAVGVNPDRKLSRICRKRGWQIVTKS